MIAISVVTNAAISASPPGPSNHWAFVPPVRPVPPTVRLHQWVRSPIDAFVLARLESAGVRPSPEADRRTLIRRLSLDLAGLPPSPDEIDAFERDRRSDAYERLVDRLLQSPHFGERWARHWLDLARYADSSGYQVDRERPWAWVYRDWVVRSFNRDQPFDQFTLWQLAGDEVAGALTGPERRDAIIASGFHRMTLSNHEDGADAAEFAARAKVDRVAATGTAWLGLTLGCAECHSHKYDPIQQREFYSVYAFFNNIEEADLPVDGGVTAYSFHALDRPRETRVHIRGDFRRLGEAVEPGFLACLGVPAASTNGSLRRADLARWITSRENPLTARVGANQIWMHLFGRGLVATPEDFGVRGETPSHPALLDWLATEWVRQGWSRKGMIREIVESSTYRQSSRARPELAERDPENRWLARQNRVRLEGEILRDEALAVSGMLNGQIGGRSYRPHLPEDIKALSLAGAWSWADDAGPTVWRRSLYQYFQRTVSHPLLEILDQANPSESCPRRERSDTALQALALLNDEVFVAAARALGGRLSRVGSPGARGRVARARFGFETCLGREPSTAEAARFARLESEMEKTAPGQASFVAAQTWLNLDEFLNRE